MRKQFAHTVETIMGQDNNLITLLGDIGVFGFRNVFLQYPERIYNIGICEQAITSLAAGLSKIGLIPVVHSIAPFVVERCFEQLKIDFGYQKLGGNFVSVGASFDYAGLGCTHHCPGDIALLKAIPGMEIVVPGTAAEFDNLFNETYNNNHPTYFRLSEHQNKESNSIKFGKANVIKKGNLGTIIVIGPFLDLVIEAAKNVDISILYYTTISPFDSETLLANAPTQKIVVVEPYYFGELSTEIHLALKNKAINLKYIGVPHNFLTNYGSYVDQLEYIGLTKESIQKQIMEYLDEKII